MNMTTIEYGHLYIDGRWAAPASTERIRVTEAATEEHLGSVPAATERDIDAAVAAARKAFDDPEGWASWSPARRGGVLARFPVALEARGAGGKEVGEPAGADRRGRGDRSVERPPGHLVPQARPGARGRQHRGA